MRQGRIFPDPPAEDLGGLEDCRALSLHQPWGTLVAIKAKGYETRGWGTDYRGLVGIHASKGWEEDEIALCSEEPFAKVITDAGYRTARELVNLGGHVIAIARITDSIHMTEEFIEKIRLENPNEIAFGAWLPGRYALKLEDVKKLDTPIPLRGMLGLFPWPEGARLFGTTNSR